MHIVIDIDIHIDTDIHQEVATFACQNTKHAYVHANLLMHRYTDARLHKYIYIHPWLANEISVKEVQYRQACVVV